MYVSSTNYRVYVILARLLPHPGVFCKLRLFSMLPIAYIHRF